MTLYEPEFDKAADEELHALDRALADMDPDEVDVELSSAVLTLTLADGNKIIINSHRAARQIWMAAFRTAWHFSPTPTGWRTDKDELRQTLTRILSEKLGRELGDTLSPPK